MKKISQIGRSMVEMLGVLAIVGVLSVGAIAGYSKAMFKYKLNKHAQSLNMLISNAIQIGPKLTAAFKEGDNFNASLFNQLSLVPDGLTYKNNYLYDVFGNRLGIAYSRNSSPQHPFIHYYIFFSMEKNGTKLTNQAKEVCRNTILTAKEHREDLNRIEIQSALPEGSESSYAAQSFRGNKYCTTSSQKCLKDVGITEIEEICSFCESERTCGFVIYFPPTGDGL